MHNRKICVLASDIRNAETVSYLNGIVKGANALGFSTVTYSMLQNSELMSNGEEQIFELVDFDDYDGVIIVSTSFGSHPSLLDSLVEKVVSECTIPVVSIGSSENIENIIFNESQVCSEKMIDHLIEEHNCENIYILGGTKNSIQSLAAGVVKSFEKHNMKIDEDNFFYGGYWIDCAERMAKDIASETIPMPDAIFCIDETIAKALVRQMFHYGYSVPGDVKIVSIDRSPETETDILPLTTVSYNGDVRGYEAVASLYKKITGENAPEKRMRPPVFTIGVSCGCGVRTEKNLRFRFEKKEIQEHEEMLFRNSYIEEKLLSATSMTDFINELKKVTYLIARKKYFNVSLLTDDLKTATNIYVSKQKAGILPSKPFKASKLFCDDIFFEEEGESDCTFTYVLPLIFGRKMHGFMAIVYYNPNVYDKIALQFAKVLSIGLERLKQLEEAKKQVRDQLMTETTPAIQQTTPDIEVHYQASSEDDISIFANKNGVMCKVVVENILYFEANGGKIYVALKSGKYETKQKLFEIEEQLSARGFLRISKSVIINMNKVVNFRPGDDRTIIVKLSNNEEIKVTRSYAKDFRDKMKF